jgi:hypothetical protein
MIVAATRAAAVQVEAHYRFNADESVRPPPTMPLEAAHWDMDVHTSDIQAYDEIAGYSTADDEQHEFDAYVQEWKAWNQDPSVFHPVDTNRKWNPENDPRDHCEQRWQSNLSTQGPQWQHLRLTAKGDRPPLRKQIHTLNTSPVGEEWFHRAMKNGVMLIDLFGGIGTNLQAMLQCKFPISRYVYVHNDHVAQRTMRHRLQRLQIAHNNQHKAKNGKSQWYARNHGLPSSAIERAFDTLPMDITQITPCHINELVKEAKQRGLALCISAGFPCQDISSASSAPQGLTGSRSCVYDMALQVIGTAQGKGVDVAYMIENVAMQHAKKNHTALRAGYHTLMHAIMHRLMHATVFVPFVIALAKDARDQS